ncbi:DUF1499 domain-containing protein [Roseobacter sp.]|uniref:DUF1499 domain-containing protein n=1 Tax=Roseobacter sp. TaxID=1907202 RepID=UPI00329777E2
MGKNIAWVLVAGIFLALAYVRLAPLDPARWHRPVPHTADVYLTGGAARVIPGDAGIMAQADAALRAEPRTRVLAGSVDSGRVTYATRSAVIGFPDLTTIELHGDQLRIYGRLRFGRSDLGVNRARLQRVIAAVQSR